MRTLLRVDLELDEDVDQGDQEVAGDVGGTATHQNVGVLEVDLARDLDHAKHDDQVGAVMVALCQIRSRRCDAPRGGIADTDGRDSETYICGLTILAMLNGD
jgi:hypothetical protein